MSNAAIRRTVSANDIPSSATHQSDGFEGLSVSTSSGGSAARTRGATEIKTKSHLQKRTMTSGVFKGSMHLGILLLGLIGLYEKEVLSGYTLNIASSSFLVYLLASSAMRRDIDGFGFGYRAGGLLAIFLSRLVLGLVDPRGFSNPDFFELRG